MKKETIKLTESRLRSLVEACVKEALEDAIEEGYGWDAFKDAAKDDLSKERFPSKDEFDEFVAGEPNHNEFRRAKDSYEAAKDGMIYTDGGKRSSDPNEYAREATWAQPGLAGKAKRTAMGAGLVGKMALDKGKAAVKKGFKKMVNKKENNSGSSFTL